MGITSPRALDDDLIADADVQVAHVVFVVQRGGGDGDAADFDGIEHGVGRGRARAPNLDKDVGEPGNGFACGKFVGDGPARVFAGEAEFVLYPQRIDLDHNAVDLKGLLIAPLGKRFDKVDQRLKFGVRKAPIQRANGEAERFKIVQRLPVRDGGIFSSLQDHGVVNPELERARRRDGAVQLAQRPRGKVARVGVGRFLALDAFGVDLFKIGNVDIRLAARDQPSGRGQRCSRVARDLQRKLTDGAQIGGNVLALLAVAAGGAQRERAILVMEHNGQPIKFWLYHKGKVGGLPGVLLRLDMLHAIQPPLDALAPGLKLFGVEGVGEREHGRRVAHALEALGNNAANAHGGAVRRAQIGVFGLQRLQLAEERVKFGV